MPNALNSPTFKMSTEYRQREPFRGAGYNPAGNVETDGTKDNEFSRGAGDAKTSFTEDTSAEDAATTFTEDNDD